jgi:uncharacterized protein (DUF2141 family)
VTRLVAWAAGVLVVLAGARAEAGTLEVEVSGIRNAHGHVLAAVCSAETFLSAHCRPVGRAPAHEGTVMVRISDVPPDTCAVQVFHDENDNLEIDRSFLGIPKEGMGFSNDATFHFGPPRFADAAIAVSPRGGRITVKMRYF